MLQPPLNCRCDKHAHLIKTGPPTYRAAFVQISLSVAALVGVLQAGTPSSGKRPSPARFAARASMYIS
eukprot:875904-Pelagomonas_calceolata.AAC.1